MKIRRVQANEGDLLRELRIRMVSDSPNAFNDRVEDVRSRPQSAWDAAAVHFASASDGVYYIADDGQQACGTLECMILPKPELSRAQVQTIGRVMGGAALTDHDLQVLGEKLFGVLQANAGSNLINTLPAFTNAGVSFVDVIRICICFFGPAAEVSAGWDWDSLILPGQTAFLGDVWVAPPSRGNGLGRKLLDTAQEWAQLQGARRTFLFVTETQTNAIRLYERAGFTATGHRIRFPPNPTLFIHAMAKEL